MTIRTFATVAMLSLSLVTFASPAAQAEGYSVRHFPQLARPVAEMKVRSGPGSMFPQTGVVSKAEQIIVHSCNAGWCVIQQQDGGPSGFMTDAYLIFMGEIHG